jgi:hypothetical protein
MDQEDEYLECLYSSLVMYSLGMVLIFCLYWGLVMNVDEKYGVENNEITDENTERAISYKQVRFVWYLFGRFLFLALLFLLVAASFRYLESVNIFLQIAKGTRTSVSVAFFTSIFVAHLAFVPLQLSKLSHWEQTRGLEPLMAFGPPVVRDFTVKAAQKASLLIAPPSQRGSHPPSGSDRSSCNAHL